jgi:hypothetical protein
MTRLSWPDLFSQDPDLDFERLLSLWPSTVSGIYRPVGMSAFGDIYIERPTNEIERLDVLEGGLHQVAANMELFKKLMNSQTWMEENLLSQAVALLISRGLKRGPAQCFALTPHPVWTGRIDFERAMVMDAYPWHSICSQALDAPASNHDSETI